jgi:phosphatidylserine/phosphatidylglycerophosphate/cardiolipin synthase-like enzyme
VKTRRPAPGSFNFTAAAQKRNAENLLVIEDRALAALYDENWGKRRAVSMRYSEPLPPDAAMPED